MNLQKRIGADILVCVIVCVYKYSTELGLIDDLIVNHQGQSYNKRRWLERECVTQWERSVHKRVSAPIEIE